MGNLKVTDAQQAKIIKIFKNAKQKLLTTKAAIWINKVCRINNKRQSIYELKLKVMNKVKMQNCTSYTFYT